MNIAIASGKGGTGKTTIAISLASCYAKNGMDVALLDCDVEEPNVNLFLKAEIEKTEAFNVLVPHVDESRCNGCGECERICAFSAIVLVKGKPLLFADMCHSCGGCFYVCPERAIYELEKTTGVIESGSSCGISFAGGGLIGIEVTESFINQGMNVTIIEKMDKVLPSLLDDEIAFHAHNELKSQGVTLVLGAAVTKINGDDRGNVISVSTAQGDFPADLVLVAIGNKPTVSLAVDAGLDIGATGAIRVDKHLRTSDPSIYAGGDCVENTSIVTGKPMYAPMGSTANKHGRIIADNICGIPSEFPGVMGTVICRVFDINVARTGLTESNARQSGYNVITVLSPAPDRPHFLPEAKLIIIKLIVDSATRKVIGAQIIGPGDVAKRIEVVITAMTQGLKIDDYGNLDLAYAPPFSPAMDNIITAANIAQNKINGIASSLPPREVKEKIDRNDDFILLDVRSPQEFEQVRIDDKRVTLIPLGKLRERSSELPKDKEIIPFCKISLRGYEAQKILEAAGFTNVRFMDGGIVCWPYAKIGKNKFKYTLN